MPRKDKTFTDKDVARIICQHLDNDEKARLHALFRQDGFDCNFRYEDEADEDEKKKIRDINIDVEVDVGLLSALSAFFVGLIAAAGDSYDQENKRIEIEKQERLSRIQRELLFLRGLQDNIPKGRNRESFDKALLIISDESTILSPCVAVKDAYEEIENIAKEVDREIKVLEKEIEDLAERIKNWFN